MKSVPQRGSAWVLWLAMPDTNPLQRGDTDLMDFGEAIDQIAHVKRNVQLAGIALPSKFGRISPTYLSSGLML